MKNAIVEYLDYQTPGTRLKGPKGNGDMQAAKRSQYMVKWAVDRFRRYGRSKGRGKLFFGQSIGIDETNTYQLKFCI